jgi:HEAT repeat protein
VAVDHRLGWFRLAGGRHVLTFTCVGKDSLSTDYNLGVEGVVLEEIPAFVQATSAGLPSYETMEVGLPAPGPAAGVVYRGRPLSFYVARLQQATEAQRTDLVRSIGAFGEDAAPAVGELARALGDRDADVRAAAAEALAQVGPQAAPAAPRLAKLLIDENLEVREAATLALGGIGKRAASAIPNLCAALKDPAGTVRMSAAWALGRMGDTAQPAVPALIEAFQVPDENQLTNEGVQVLRNIAYALGDIGPAAATAVPALQQATHIRIKYIAMEAVAKIQGKPVPTWH